MAMSMMDYCDICGELREVEDTEEGLLCLQCLHPADYIPNIDKVVSYETLEEDDMEELAYG